MRFGRISNLLTLSEINQATEQVYSLNPIWLNRSTCKPRVPFWTLGAVTYLEGCDDMKKYHKHKEAVNPLLRRKFTWLYDILCGTLENELGDPCVIDDMLGHPGFHIFGTKPGVTATPWQLEMMQEPLASVHLDIQYKEHGPYWKTYEEVDFANPLSFTMAIKLPKTGGGLFIWDWMNFEGDLVKDFNYQTEQEKWSYIDEQFAGGGGDMDALGRQAGLQAMGELAHVLVVRCILQGDQIVHGLHEHRRVARLQIERTAGDEGVKSLEVKTDRPAPLPQRGPLAHLIDVVEADNAFHVLEVIETVDAQIGVVAELAQAKTFQFPTMK